MSKNAPPTPTNVKFTFGENGEPRNIVFRYDNKMKNGKEIMEWIRQYSHGFGTGYRFKKEELVFDGEFHFGGYTFRGVDIEGKTLQLNNLLLNDAEFFDSVTDDDIVLNMKMSYDHFIWKS